MQTVIASTDFSAASVNAVKYAADLALFTGSNLTLFHVFPVPFAFSEIPAPDYTVKELSDTAEENIAGLREKIVAHTGGRLNIHTEIRQGHVLTELGLYCESINPYAVVMGSESGGKFERFLFGGSTVSAVKQLSWPVIVVPPDMKFTGLHKIALACDFLNVPETIPIKEIRQLVREFKAELHVLHASTDSGSSFREKVVEGSEWLQEILEGLNPVYHFIKDKQTEKGIAEFAEKNNIDLLIIIPKKHSLVHKIFQYSHSKRLVLYAHVPVMSIHE